MLELIARLLTSLALQSQPTCAPDPFITWQAPPNIVGERECMAFPDHEYRCSAEGGHMLLRRWYADVAGVSYKVEVRERLYGLEHAFAGQRVYRNLERVHNAPLVETFAGEKMHRIRPETCDLPDVTLTDA